MNDNFTEQYEESEMIRLKLVWGLDDIDRTGENAWDPEYVGKVIFDDQFNIATVENQEFLLTICQQIRNLKLVSLDEPNDEFWCWPEKFKSFLASNHSQLYPVQTEQEFLEYIQLWKEVDEDYSKDVYQDEDLKIKFMLIRVRGRISKETTYSTKKPEYDNWEEWVESYNSQAPTGLNNMMQTSNQWPNMMQERAFVTSAVQGIIISISFAFIVLMIATNNIIQSVLAIFCVSLVIVSTVSVMFLSGYELGVAESVAVVVQIGLSVDYVVHLSTDYMHSPLKSRNDKMRQAYKQMGISIFSGTLTTFGSGAFLFGG